MTTESTEHLDSINPATGEVIGRYALAGEEEAREAVAAALTTFRDTSWRTDRALRSRVPNEIAERFQARSADIIQLMSLEVAKVVPKAAFEVGMAARAALPCRARPHGVWPGRRMGTRTILAPGTRTGRRRRHQRAVERTRGPADSLTRPGARSRLTVLVVKPVLRIA